MKPLIPLDPWYADERTPTVLTSAPTASVAAARLGRQVLAIDLRGGMHHLTPRLTPHGKGGR